MTASPSGGPEPDRHRKENFPVASFILRREHREAVMAFYRFARKADDIADDPTRPPDDKRLRLDEMRRALAGEGGGDTEACDLRRAALRRDLSVSHGLELLEAFRRDVDTPRYGTFEELLDYCRYSAMPVGRFVLDVHGESPNLWPASDALCAALQVINHLQDCRKDFLEMDRVYLPLEDLRKEACAVEDLGADQASPGLRRVIRGLAGRTRLLLEASRPFAAGIRDSRLAYEVAVIQKLAEDLTDLLHRRDPLSEHVHHRPLTAARLAVAGVAEGFAQRRRRPR